MVGIRVPIGRQACFQVYRGNIVPRDGAHVRKNSTHIQCRAAYGERLDSLAKSRIAHRTIPTAGQTKIRIDCGQIVPSHAANRRKITSDIDDYVTEGDTGE